MMIDATWRKLDVMLVRIQECGVEGKKNMLIFGFGKAVLYIIDYLLIENT